MPSTIKLEGALQRPQNGAAKNQTFANDGVASSYKQNKLGIGAKLRFGPGDFRGWIEAVQTADVNGVTNTVSYATTSHPFKVWTMDAGAPNLQPPSLGSAPWNGEIAIATALWNRYVGKWWAFAHGGNNSPNKRQIFLLSSYNWNGSWTVENGGNPILSYGAAGSFTENGIADPVVKLRVTGTTPTLYLFHRGFNGSNKCTLGFAKSTDVQFGATWSAPVQMLTPQGTGWEADQVFGLDGFEDADARFHAWYVGQSTGGVQAIGYAYSDDWTTASTPTWTRGANNPVRQGTNASTDPDWAIGDDVSVVPEEDIVWLETEGANFSGSFSPNPLDGRACFWHPHLRSASYTYTRKGRCFTTQTNWEAIQAPSGNYTLDQTVSSIYIEFKLPPNSNGSSSPPSRMLWVEDGGIFSKAVQVAVNNAGKLTGFVQIGGTGVSITGTTTVDDDQWHRARFLRTAAGAWELKVDNVSQGTSTTNPGTDATSCAASIGNFIAANTQGVSAPGGPALGSVRRVTVIRGYALTDADSDSLWNSGNGSGDWTGSGTRALDWYNDADHTTPKTMTVNGSSALVEAQPAPALTFPVPSGQASGTLRLTSTATGAVLDRGTEAGSIGTLRTAAAGQLALHATAAPALPSLKATAAATLLDRGTEAGVIGPLRLTAAATRSGPKRLQMVQNASTGGTTLTLTFPNPITAGSAIVIALLAFGSGSPPFPSSISDTLGSTYTNADDEPNGAFTRRVQVHYAKNAAAGSCTVTLTMSAVGSFAAIGVELGNVNAAAPFDTFAHATATSTSASSGPLTTAAADEYLLAVHWSSSARTITPAAGWTVVGTPQAVAGTDQLVVAERLTAATGTFSGDATLDASSNWVSILTTFKLQGAGVATKLAFEQTPQGAWISGAAGSIQPIVQVQDGGGALEATDNSTQVVATITRGNGTLVGTATVTCVGGRAVFTNLGISQTTLADDIFNITFSKVGGGLTACVTSNLFVCSATAQAAALPQTFLNTNMPTRTGALIRLGAGGDLQAAMNAANPGDWIVLDHTATFTGDYVFPAKTGADAQPGGNNVIVIISDAIVDSGLLPASKRVSPSDATNMPKIRTATSNGICFTATLGVANVGGWRLVGLDIGPAVGNTADMTRIVRFGSEVALTDNGVTQPFNFGVDRCYIHCDNATQNIQHGVSLHSSYSFAIDNYIENIHHNGADAQAIWAGQQAVGLKIVNNFAEATGENIFIGGSDGIDGFPCTDIEVRYNYMFKRKSWNPNDPSYAGVAWVIKNIFEIKFGRRILIEGNILDGIWTPSAQNGFAFLIKSNNNQAIPTTDVTIRYNLVRNASGFFDVTGQTADTAPAGSFPPWMARLNIHDNLCVGLGDPLYYGSASAESADFLLALQHFADFVFEHNTALPPRFFINLDDPSVPYKVRPVYRNNVAQRGAYGVKAAGQIEGTTSLAAADYSGVYTFAGNVVAGATAGSYPAGNYFPADVASIGLVDATLATSGALSASSSYKGLATDGKDPGVDWPTLSSAISLTESGDRTSAGGAISGTLAKTLTLTTAASGALLDRGATAGVVGVLRLAAQGTLAPAGSVQGSGTPALGTLRVASAGALRVAASASALLGTLRGSGTGTSGAFGTASGGHTYVALDDTRRYVVRTGTMSLLKVVIAVGDTAPPITGTLLLADRVTPQNLTGATVTLEVRNAVTGAVLFAGRPVTLVDAANGKVQYAWQSGDTATAARYEGRWHVTYADGTKETFPNGHDGFPIHIEQP